MNKYVGIGFRRDIADELTDNRQFNPAFIELGPENWIGMGGFWRKKLLKAAEKYPITSHGLSLSIGSPDELDWQFLGQIKDFLKEFNVQVYSEHLSYTKTNNAHLYDLLPIPFREDAVNHVIGRIRQVQEFLGRRIAIENVSYYTPVAAEMTEYEFINAIVKGSDCRLLLDINNVYVNAFNHGYDPKKFITSLPLDTVEYIHMAGHEKIDDDLIIDTHGQPIIEQVYELFEWTLEHINPVPVLLERDFNFDDLESISDELNTLEKIAVNKWELHYEPTFARN